MTKGQVYDSQIAPLMEQIIEICKQTKIAMIADFGLDDDIHCTSALLANEYFPSDGQLEALKAVSPKRGIAVAETIETLSDGSKRVKIQLM
jgi:hypothetical protein